MKPATKSWYAIRTKPGYQRVARMIEDAEERRKSETIIERNLRNDGIDVCMPSFWFETRHHRTNRIVERRLPLLVGYTFVHIAEAQFEKVRDVDGVMCFLRLSLEYGPTRFRDRDLEQLVFDDFERGQRFRFEQHCRVEEAKSHRVFQLRSNLRKFLPKGRGVRINMRAQAEKALQTMEGAAKERVVAILRELDNLTGDEIGPGKAA